MDVKDVILIGVMPGSAMACLKCKSTIINSLKIRLPELVDEKNNKIIGLVKVSTEQFCVNSGCGKYSTCIDKCDNYNRFAKSLEEFIESGSNV